MSLDQVFADYTELTVWKLADRGYTRSEIAKATGISVNRVLAVLQGPRPPATRGT